MGFGQSGPRKNESCRWALQTWPVAQTSLTILVGAADALAPIDFVVLKSCKFLASRSRSHRKSQKVSSAPALLGLIGVLDNE